MRRIDTPTARNGRFVNGNKLTNTKATQFNAEWCNAVQEEICKLIEAAGQSLDGSNEQLARIFTELYVLEATMKSLALQKILAGGGYSSALVNADKVAFTAVGNLGEDDNQSEFSRMMLQLTKTVSGLRTSIEVAPNRIDFKSGNPLAEHASIHYDPTTGTVTISGLGGIVFSDKAFAFSGIVGDVETDSIVPSTPRNPVTVGSGDGGVAFVGPVAANKGLEALESVVSHEFVGAKNVPMKLELLTRLEDQGRMKLASEWSIGQVKKIFNDTDEMQSLIIAVPTSFDVDGTATSSVTRVVGLGAYSYKEFTCVGKTTVDDVEYAILAPAG